MGLNGELGICGLSLELGMWMSIMICKYGCTPLGSVVFTTILSLVGGVVVEVPTKICCGGVSGALELGRALASCSLRLRLELQLYSGLCKHECIKLCVPFSHSLCMYCIVLGWWCWLGSLCVGEMALPSSAGKLKFSEVKGCSVSLVVCMVARSAWFIPLLGGSCLVRPW
jgi:hypothetical protein